MCGSIQGKPAGRHHTGRPRLGRRLFGDLVHKLGCGSVQAVREHAPIDNARMEALIRHTRRVRAALVSAAAAVATLTGAAAPVHGQRFVTRRQAKDEVVAWLLWYNQTRLHSTLAYVSPMRFEQDWLAAQAKQVNS